MGKARKNKTNCNRYSPLDQQTSENYDPKSSPRNKIKNILPKDDETVITSKSVKKEESFKKEDSNEGSEFPKVNANWSNAHMTQSNTRSGLTSLDGQSSVDSSDVSQSEKDDENEGDVDDKGEEGDDDEDENDKFLSVIRSEWDGKSIKIDKKDEITFARFMGTDVENRVTLADFVKQKLTEKTNEFHVYTDVTDNTVVKKLESDVSPYKELAPVLESYKSGKFPKLFKRIPDFLNWEQVLYLTEPDKWSTASVFEATCIFSINKDPVVVQRFFNTILLLRIRDKIADSKTLDTPLYHALRRALHNPPAFFKGIILPLCKAKNCTFKEATILGFILARGYISHIHCSAALLTVAEMKYSLTNSIFMGVLLNKMYPLSSRVLNAIVAHFHRFMEDTTKYPLPWHHCLLTFVEIYKDRLTAEQTKIILQLLTVQRHHPITEKILRELWPFLL